MPEGSYCTITIDASATVGRVIFDETSYLGLDFAEGDEVKKVGDVISYEEGIHDIKIYNAGLGGGLDVFDRVIYNDIF